MRSSTTYFTALTLFNREVAKWLEQQDNGEPSLKISRHDKPTASVGLAGTVLSSNIYGTVTGKTCIGKLSEFIGILTPNC